MRRNMWAVLREDRNADSVVIDDADGPVKVDGGVKK